VTAISFTPWAPQQDRAIFFDEPIGVFAAGIQSGKTKAGAAWMKIQNHKFTARSDNFLIVAPTYKILQQSTLPPYLEMMWGCGEYSKADAVFRIDGGGTVYFRTATDPDSIVGITNIRAIWGDEAGLFTLYFSENIAARAAFKGAQTLYTTSPYTLNWLYKQIILPKMKDPKARPDVNLVQAASWQNPYFPREVIERNRQTMDARRFNALFGGQWQRMAGLVYDCFDDEENQCPAIALPTGTRYVGGIDWGFTDPFVFRVRAITPEGFHFGVHEFYRAGLVISEIVTIVARLVEVWGVTQIYCDPSQPAHIEELNRRFRTQGLRCSAVGANNDIRMGIDRHYELIKSRRIKYFRDVNPHFMDEVETYHYPEPKDLTSDQNSKDLLPVTQADHVMDVERYITISTFESKHRLKAVVPEETQKVEDQFQRLARLKRGPRRAGGGSESW
jgi:hypothetical protein